MMGNVHNEIPVRASNGARCDPGGHTEKGHELHLASKPFRELLIEVLHRGAAFRFKAKGFSMSPFIKDGDVITVVPISSYEPHLGDVVVFTSPGTEELVIHRLVAKRDNSHVLIKGDNLPTREHLVAKRRILGSAKRVQRDGRTVALGLGPEKALIALLSRRSLLLPLLHALFHSTFLRRFSR